MTSLLQRLSAERNRKFVGREREVELFLDAIASRELPFHILHVFGPGGVGKTTLIQQFLRFCEQSKISTIYVEGRNIEAAPESFVSTLRSLMGLNESDFPLHVLAQRQERNVILIDTYSAIRKRIDWRGDVDYTLLEQCLGRAVWCRFIYPQVYRFTLISTPSPATMFCWLPSLKIIGSPLLPSVTTVVALGQNCDS